MKIGPTAPIGKGGPATSPSRSVPAAAKTFAPSADVARATQFVCGALVSVQVWASAGDREMPINNGTANDKNKKHL